MLFDINKVKKNKMRSRETRSRSFLLKRAFADLESRILDLNEKWDYALIEGCRRSDLSELGKNNKITISEFTHNSTQAQSIDLYANLMQLHLSLIHI